MPQNILFSSRRILQALCFNVFFFASVAGFAQVGIGLGPGQVPQASLEIGFNSAVAPGFLMPRVTSFPSGAIAEGMLIYYHGDSSTETYYVYLNGVWTPLATTAGVATPDTQAPSAPTSLIAASPTTSTIDLAWTASTDNVGVTGYYIYFSDNTLAATVTSGTSTIITGLSASTEYTFYATAYDAAGNESASSNTATETTTAISCYVVGDYDAVNKGVVYWADPSDCSHYKIVSLIDLDFNGDDTRDWANADDDIGANAQHNTNGYLNTETYVTYYSAASDEHDTAPWLAWHFDPNGGTSHVGWYLGAINEWRNDLYSELSTVNEALGNISGATALNVSSDLSNEYWSSTEKPGGGSNSRKYAYAISLSDGEDYTRDKDEQKRVRAFREIGD